jgi:3'-5' exoribonuclease
MKIFANALEPNQQVQTTFLVLNKDVRQKKTGEPYLSLVLGDKTGDIDAKMWDGVADIVDTFERNDYVKVRGQATVYQNKLQLRVDRLQRADEREIEPAANVSLTSLVVLDIPCGQLPSIINGSSISGTNRSPLLVLK